MESLLLKLPLTVPYLGLRTRHKENIPSHFPLGVQFSWTPPYILSSSAWTPIITHYLGCIHAFIHPPSCTGCSFNSFHRSYQDPAICCAERGSGHGWAKTIQSFLNYSLQTIEDADFKHEEKNQKYYYNL